MRRPEGLRGPLSGHRERQHAHGPHHHAGDRDSHCLLPHGFHPLFGSMLGGMLDQRNPARSDGDHREFFFRRSRKKRKNRPGKGTGAPAVSIRRRGRCGRRNPDSSAVSRCAPCSPSSFHAGAIRRSPGPGPRRVSVASLCTVTDTRARPSASRVSAGTTNRTAVRLPAAFHPRD